MSPVRRLAPVILVAAAGLSGSGAILAQQPQTPQQTFRSGVQVVEVDVRVFDRDGRFVTTLTRDDFEVLEDGVPQQLVAMALVGAASEPGAITAPTSPPSTAATTATATHAPTTARHTWIFFFDLNHLTPGGGFDRARKAAAGFIRERFREGDLAGIVGRDGMINNRLTTVRQELVAAVESIKPSTESRSRHMELTREWPRFLNEDEAIQIVNNRRDVLENVVRRACADEPAACLRATPDEEVRQKAHRMVVEIQRATLETLKTINALATGLARMPGPKTIVFLSDGFPIGRIETTLRSIVGQVARAGARVYAIDARGLDRGRGARMIDQAQSDGTPIGTLTIDALEDGANSLAVDTGGMMIRNENNIGRALDQIAADTNVYYVLGYQPSNTNFDGKYRKIEIRVKRPEVRVRARQGYLALEPARMLVPQPIRREELAPAVPSAAAPAPPEAPPPVAAVGEAIPPPAVVANPASAVPMEGAVRIRPGAAENVRALSGAHPNAAAGTASDEASRGWSAYQRGDLEAALPLFEQAGSRPDAQPWALYALGLTYAGLGKPRQALAAWERVRTASSDYKPVYIDLAATYASLGELSQALAVLRDAEKQWPDDADVHNGIGVIHVRRGALDQAIDAFAKAAAAAPGEALTHLNLGRAYELRYVRDLRFVSSQRRWVAPEEDRKKAAASYERCIALGGPYAQQAAEALSRLQWSK